MAYTRQKIGLLDHLGGGNLGDDATLDAVMQNIKRRWPDAEIFGFSMNPSDTQTRHGITSYPIRRHVWHLGHQLGCSKVDRRSKIQAVLRKYYFLFYPIKAIYTLAVRAPKELFQELLFLAKSFRLLRSFDFLIVSGGGQLTDWFGTWNFPYTLFAWTLLARLARTKRLFINVGAGPLTHPIGKLLVKRALLCSNYASFRDEPSQALARETGFKRTTQVFPDCVYGLDKPTFDTGGIRRSDKPMVGIAPMPYCDPRSVYPKKNQGVYDRFIQTLGLFGCGLLRSNYSLKLFYTDIGVDLPAVQDLEASLRTNAITTPASVSTACINTTAALLAAMSSMDYVVTCRFHGVVFAHILNIPIVAISHHPKMDTLMAALGLSEYCFDIRTVNDAVLTNTFALLVSNREKVKSRMAESLSRYKKELSIQFDTLFPPQFC